MLIKIIDKNGVVGHPTTQFGYVIRKHKLGKVKLIKGSLTKGGPITVQILDLEIDPSKTVDAKFRVGIDPGYEHIGFCVIKETIREVKVLYRGELTLRTSQVTKNMAERKMYRNNRRRNRRLKARRRSARTGIAPRFRHPIWKNRKCDRKYTPTVQYVIQMHQNLLHKITSGLPFDQMEVHLEVFSYDSQKINNPAIKPWMYSQGPQQGYSNTRAYILARDNHTCQAKGCKCRTGVMQVHHVVFKRDGGTNAPSNLITLCEACHKKVHAGMKLHVKGLFSTQKAASVLNTAIPDIKRSIEYAGIKLVPTYGYITKDVRWEHDIEKTHANDAMIIAVADEDWLDVDVSKLDIDGSFEYEYVSKRRHDRAVTIRYEDRKYKLPIGTLVNGGVKFKTKPEAWNRKARTAQEKKKPSLDQYRKTNPTHNLVVFPGGSLIKREYHKPPVPVKFRPGDIAVHDDSLTKNEAFTVKSWASTQGKVISETIDDVETEKKKKTVYKSYKTSECRRILNNAGMVQVV